MKNSQTAILIVEDEMIVAEDLAGMLRQLGYEIAGIAASGEQAVELAGRLRPQLILMDIQLAGALDGIEAARALQRQDDSPVIYLTAHADAATLSRAKLTGPMGYILKPFEERDLATQIELALYKHRTDRLVREQREWLRVILTSIGDAVIATDAAGYVNFVNPVAESLTGWQAETVMGRPLSDVFRLRDEQTGRLLEDRIARLLRDGKPLPIINQVFLVTRSGASVPIEGSAQPLQDADRRVVGTVLVFRDVTATRRAQEALRSSNQELQEFVYALSNNIKAPFRAVENYANFLTEDLSDELAGEPQQYLAGLKRAVDQANNQFRDLEALYNIKNHEVQFETVEPAELFEELKLMFPNTADRTLRITGHWPRFLGAKFLLRQTLVALVNNGFKFNQADSKRVEIGWQRTPDNRIEIFVRDNGIGIDPRYHAQIFEIFKRLHTDRQYVGTGIGLAIVRRAVENMGGTLRVESAPGQGSTFYVSLPDSIVEF